MIKVRKGGKGYTATRVYVDPATEADEVVYPFNVNGGKQVKKCPPYLSANLFPYSEDQPPPQIHSDNFSKYSIQLVMTTLKQLSTASVTPAGVTAAGETFEMLSPRVTAMLCECVNKASGKEVVTVDSFNNFEWTGSDDLFAAALNVAREQLRSDSSPAATRQNLTLLSYRQFAQDHTLMLGAITTVRLWLAKRNDKADILHDPLCANKAQRQLTETCTKLCKRELAAASATRLLRALAADEDLTKEVGHDLFAIKTHRQWLNQRARAQEVAGRHPCQAEPCLEGEFLEVTQALLGLIADATTRHKKYVLWRLLVMFVCAKKFRRRCKELQLTKWTDICWLSSMQGKTLVGLGLDSRKALASHGLSTAATEPLLVGRRDSSIPAILQGFYNFINHKTEPSPYVFANYDTTTDPSILVLVQPSSDDRQQHSPNTISTGEVNARLKEVLIHSNLSERFDALRIHSTRVGAAILAASALSDPEAINERMGWKAGSNQFRRYARLVAIGQTHRNEYSLEELKEIQEAKNTPILECFASLFPFPQ
jgi:hypothetical protein